MKKTPFKPIYSNIDYETKIKIHEKFNEIKKSEGLVLLVDALGVKEHSIHESKEFLKKRAEIFYFITMLIDGFGATKKPNKWPFLEMLGEGSYHFFGDTAAFVFPFLKSRDDIGRASLLSILDSFGGMFMGILRTGWKQETCWRGAIGAGEFLLHRETNTVLGPAVARAAKNYEKFNWSGIVLDEESAGFLGVHRGEKILDQNNDKPIWVKYDAPISQSKKSELKENNLTESVWAACWPKIFFDHHFNQSTSAGKNACDDLSNNVNYFKWDNGEKKKNTLDFARWYYKEFYHSICPFDEAWISD